MTEDFATVRIHKDDLARLRQIAERERRSVPKQVAWLLDLVDKPARQPDPTPTPAQPETKEA